MQYCAGGDLLNLRLSPPLTPRDSTFCNMQEEDRLYLVMEYCAGGDLAHFLRRVKRLPEATARHLMRQLAAGLRQMWAHHLVHVSHATPALRRARPAPFALPCPAWLPCPSLCNACPRLPCPVLCATLSTCLPACLAVGGLAGWSGSLPVRLPGCQPSTAQPRLVGIVRTVLRLQRCAALPHQHALVLPALAWSTLFWASLSAGRFSHPLSAPYTE